VLKVNSGGNYNPSNYELELKNQIRMLEHERDHFRREAVAEKSKNEELEKEFVVLRGLIAEAQKNSATQENLMLRSHMEEERRARISAEADVAKLRQ
jgi:hypothetical protein